MMGDENAPASQLAYELDGSHLVLSVNKIAETIIAVGSIKIVISSTTRGQINKDSALVKFESVPFTKIEVSFEKLNGRDGIFKTKRNNLRVKFNRLISL